MVASALSKPGRGLVGAQRRAGGEEPRLSRRRSCRRAGLPGRRSVRPLGRAGDGDRTGRRAVGDLGHGSRAPGSSDRHVSQLIGDQLAAARRATREHKLARLAEQRQRPGGAATRLADVVNASREAALDTLLLVDRPDSADRLWAGPIPMAIGESKQDIKALGADQAYEDRLGEVLLRALIDTDGDLELLDEPSGLLPDGVGGLLRFDPGRTHP